MMEFLISAQNGLNLRLSPSNIIIPRPIVIKFPENQIKISGLNNATKEAIETNQGK